MITLNLALDLLCRHDCVRELPGTEERHVTGAYLKLSNGDSVVIGDMHEFCKKHKLGGYHEIYPTIDHCDLKWRFVGRTVWFDYKDNTMNSFPAQEDIVSIDSRICGLRVATKAGYYLISGNAPENFSMIYVGSLWPTSL